MTSNFVCIIDLSKTTGKQELWNIYEDQYTQIYIVLIHVIHKWNCFIELIDRIRAITFCINRGSFPPLWSQAWSSHHEAWCLQDACCTPTPQISLQQYHRHQNTIRKDPGHVVLPAPSQNPSHAKNLRNANTATGMFTQTHSVQNIHQQAKMNIIITFSHITMNFKS